MKRFWILYFEEWVRLHGELLLERLRNVRNKVAYADNCCMELCLVPLFPPSPAPPPLPAGLSSIAISSATAMCGPVLSLGNLVLLTVRLLRVRERLNSYWTSSPPAIREQY